MSGTSSVLWTLLATCTLVQLASGDLASNAGSVTDGLNRCAPPARERLAPLALRGTLLVTAADGPLWSFFGCSWVGAVRQAGIRYWLVAPTDAAAAAAVEREGYAAGGRCILGGAAAQEASQAAGGGGGGGGAVNSGNMSGSTEGYVWQSNAWKRATWAKLPGCPHACLMHSPLQRTGAAGLAPAGDHPPLPTLAAARPSPPPAGFSGHDQQALNLLLRGDVSLRLLTHAHMHLFQVRRHPLYEVHWVWGGKTLESKRANMRDVLAYWDTPQAFVLALALNRTLVLPRRVTTFPFDCPLSHVRTVQCVPVCPCAGAGANGGGRRLWVWVWLWLWPHR
eukprot:XP_001700330.1 predicted protein [Chlamydomonas reinhardtii]